MAFSPERLFKSATVLFDEFPVAAHLATTPGTPMYDDPETVMNNVFEKKGDDMGVAPKRSNSYEEYPIESSSIIAPIKDTPFDQISKLSKSTEEYSIGSSSIIAPIKDTPFDQISKLSKSTEEYSIESSSIIAPIKDTPFDQIIAMQDGTEDEYSRFLAVGRYVASISNVLHSYHSSVNSPRLRVSHPGLLCLSRSQYSAEQQLGIFFNLLLLLLFRNVYFHQSGTQNTNEDTFDYCMQLTKHTFTALGQGTPRTDEIGKLFGEDFLPARIHKLKEKVKRGKGASVKFKQIDEMAVLKGKLEDVESDVKYVHTVFTHVMTSMEGLLSEMKALKADIAMQAESSKGKVKWLKFGHCTVSTNFAFILNVIHPLSP